MLLLGLLLALAKVVLGDLVVSLDLLGLQLSGSVNLLTSCLGFLGSDVNKNLAMKRLKVE